MTGSSATKTQAARTQGLKAAIVPVTPFEQNCTLLWDAATMRGAVVDPGGDLDRIQGAIAEVGMTVETIFLTHGHIDHAGGADKLRAALGVEIVGPHIADKFLLDNLEKQGRAYGFEARNVTPDKWLDEGQQVTMGGHAFDILHCPGHSPGSVVFVNRAQKFAHGRRAVPRLHRPHRLPLWRPRGADHGHQDQSAATRRRFRLHLRPWTDEHHRQRTPEQPVYRLTAPQRPVVALLPLSSAAAETEWAKPE